MVKQAHAEVRFPPGLDCRGVKHHQVAGYIVAAFFLSLMTAWKDAAAAAADFWSVCQCGRMCSAKM